MFVNLTKSVRLKPVLTGRSISHFLCQSQETKWNNNNRNYNRNLNNHQIATVPRALVILSRLTYLTWSEYCSPRRYNRWHCENDCNWAVAMGLASFHKVYIHLSFADSARKSRIIILFWFFKIMPIFLLVFVNYARFSKKWRNYGSMFVIHCPTFIKTQTTNN